MFHVEQGSPNERQQRRGQAGYLEQAVQSTNESTPVTTTKGGRGVLTEIAEVAVLALGLYLVINFAIQTVHVIGLSMFPTVNDQDYLIASKIDYRLHPPQRGDIIIMRDPNDSSKDFIKRIIGLPGDRILIRGGQTYVNGHLLRESYINPVEPWTQDADWPLGQSDNQDGVLLTSDEYFVMGDNRNHSSDSRFFGAIHRNQIEARAWIRVLPLTRLGPIDGLKPQFSSTVTISRTAAA
jgi:signal peptidase I